MSNEIDKFLNRNIDLILEQTQKIEDMLDTGNYRYADDTLRSILSHMEETGNISEAQIRAIENIRRKPSTRYGRRRY